MSELGLITSLLLMFAAGAITGAYGFWLHEGKPEREDR